MLIASKASLILSNCHTDSGTRDLVKQSILEGDTVVRYLLLTTALRCDVSSSSARKFPGPCHIVTRDIVTTLPHIVMTVARCVETLTHCSDSHGSACHIITCKIRAWSPCPDFRTCHSGKILSHCKLAYDSEYHWQMNRSGCYSVRHLSIEKAESAMPSNQSVGV